MKKILITGKNSYIGNCINNWLRNWPDSYQVNMLDMKVNTWKKCNFSEYDVIIHVAGIAHTRETAKNARLYYDVNEKLSIETAEKAKREGIKQFILLSSMSVYGINTGHILKNTVPKPRTNYGKSKYRADLKVERLNSEKFKVAILRPPMVYGKGCKGNYQMLRKFALKVPFFPAIKNERSMIYVGNLVEFIKNIVDEEKQGLFFPQNMEYVSTTDMVKNIVQYNNGKVFFISFFNIIIKFALVLQVGIIQKIFGNLTYEKCDAINFVSFEKSMSESEKPIP